MDLGLRFTRFLALCLALTLFLFAGLAEEQPEEDATEVWLASFEENASSDEEIPEKTVGLIEEGETHNGGLSKDEPWDVVEISVDWLNTEFVYDGKTHQPMAAYPGMIIRVVGEGADAGTYVAEAVAEDGYRITNPVCEFTIHRAPITVDWSDTAFLYDGHLHRPFATCPEVSVRVLGAAWDAGTYVAYADAGQNYEIDNRICPFVIAPRPVEIELHYAKRVSEEDPAFALAPENLLVEGMDAQTVLDELTLPVLKNLTLQRVPGEQVGLYEYDPAALNADNYFLTFTYPFEITR